MHRDMKPENVMIDPLTLQVKVIDFGFAKIHEGECTGYMATRWYCPMQIVLGLPYGLKVDVFAVGSIFLELVNGREIFRSDSNQDQLRQLLSICGFPQPPSKQYQALQKFRITSAEGIGLQRFTKRLDGSTHELLSLMLSNQAHQRPTIHKVLEFLKQNQSICVDTRRVIGRQQQGRKKAVSASHWLTLISISLQSKEKRKRSGQKQSEKQQSAAEKRDISIQFQANCNILG